MQLYRLIGLKPAVNSEHFRGATLGPLRGRAAELEILQRALMDTAPEPAVLERIKEVLADNAIGAIEAHDAESARQAMRRHLESFDRLYLSVT